MLKVSVYSAKILAAMLKMPALKNSKTATLMRRDPFMWVWVRSPSIYVMKTRKSDRIPLKMAREREETTLYIFITKESVMEFFCLSSSYWI